MTPERYSRLMAHFDEACDLDPAQQAALIERIGAADPDLARELSDLLHHDRAAPDALDAAAIRIGALAQAASELSLAGFTCPEPARADPGGAGRPAWSADPRLQDIEVVATLAEGGMGRVLLARQRSLDREVAVKAVKPEAASADLVESLLSEALLAGSLEHPNIVPVHLLERDPQGLPLLVMKRVEGVPWAALIDQPDHPAWARLQGSAGDRLAAHLSILSSVCNALHFAHSRGVIHRDVKPENVMVGSFGEVYLVDWGIATHLDGQRRADRVRADGIVGTPGYMAPEMVIPGAQPQDVRTDVYLLGATLHHVLTGKPRHRGPTLYHILRAARQSLPYAYGPEVPEELAAICNRATHADPGQRFASAQEFRDALGDYLRHRGAIELSDAALERLRRLREALAADAPAARQVHELMTESLFGFHQSLQAWPGNARARAGLRECLMTMVEHEIDQENLPRAASLLEEITDPPAALLARLAALRERLREREAREARLREIERDQDWGIAARYRVAFFLLAGALAAALWRFTVHDQAGAPYAIPPPRLAAMMGVWLLGISLLVVPFRRHLFSTRVNRQLVLGVLCGIGGMFASRCLHVLPAPPTAAIVSMDLVVAATAAAVGGVVLARWLWLLVLIFLCGALAARLLPAWAGPAFAVSAALATAVALGLARRQGKK